jgi:hypothetical protein
MWNRAAIVALAASRENVNFTQDGVAHNLALTRTAVSHAERFRKKMMIFGHIMVHATRGSTQTRQPAPNSAIAVPASARPAPPGQSSLATPSRAFPRVS